MLFPNSWHAKELLDIIPTDLFRTIEDHDTRKKEAFAYLP